MSRDWACTCTYAHGATSQLNITVEHITIEHHNWTHHNWTSQLNITIEHHNWTHHNWTHHNWTSHLNTSQLNITIELHNWTHQNWTSQLSTSQSGSLSLCCNYRVLEPCPNTIEQHKGFRSKCARDWACTCTHAHGAMPLETRGNLHGSLSLALETRVFYMGL